MIEEFFIPHRGRTEFVFEESAKLLRFQLLRFGGGTVGQRRFELRELFPASAGRRATRSIFPQTFS